MTIEPELGFLHFGDGGKEHRPRDAKIWKRQGIVFPEAAERMPAPRFQTSDIQNYKRIEMHAVLIH